MAHKLELRTPDDGRRIVAGNDVEVLLDGREVEWTRVELDLRPDNVVSVRLTLLLGDLVIDADVLVALQAMADARTEVVIADRKAGAENEGG